MKRKRKKEQPAASVEQLATVAVALSVYGLDPWARWSDVQNATGTGENPSPVFERAPTLESSSPASPANTCTPSPAEDRAPCSAEEPHHGKDVHRP